jgi:hypothetical protein
VSEGTCSALSLAADEPLAGTAGRATAFLLLEVRGAWEREAVDGLAEQHAGSIREWLSATPRSKALFIRRPDRRGDEITAFVVRAAADSPTIRQFRLSGYDDLLDVDLDSDGGLVPGPVALVCGHGRRDACCARLGRPLYDALRDELGPDSLWLSSHQGGHRFAPNLLWLPEGLQFGRVAPAEAPALVRELQDGRLSLDRLRGRTTFPPEAQAAEIAVRATLGITGLSDVALVSAENGHVELGTPGGRVEVTVEAEEGPALPASCGAVPEPAKRYVVNIIDSRHGSG